MAKNYRNYEYFENNPNIVKIFNDLDAYLDFCRFELRDFNPADLYKKDSVNWQAYQYSRRPKRPWTGERRPYLGNKPRFENRTSK